MNIYSIKQYCEALGISERSFYYRQKRGILPTSHDIMTFSPKIKLIVIHDECTYCNAAIEYHVKSQGKSDKWNVAMELCVKYDLGVKKFCKIIGI